MIIHSSNRAITLPSKMDSDAMLYYTFYLKPPIWTADTEMIEGDIVSPSSPTGFIYQVISGGLSGSIEPTWSSVKNNETTDNTVIYKAINNTAYLTANSTLTDATITASNAVPIADSNFESNGKIYVKVGPVADSVTEFSLQIAFTVNTGFSTTEYDERTIRIRVTER